MVTQKRLSIIGVLGVMVLFAGQPLCQVHQSAIAQEVPRFNYDRVEVIGEFLAAAYPEIAGADGTLNLDAELPNSADIHFTFRRCHWGSGVPGPGQPPPPVPSCWPSPPVDKQPFIAAHILGFTADRNRPVDSIYLGGSYITDKLETLRAQFKGRIYTERSADKLHSWTQESALETLQAENPAYGPDHKKQFLAVIPIASIQKVTGCKLSAETAEFQVLVWPTQPPRLEWVIKGDATATDLSPKASCSASFEPFYGRLTSFAIRPAATDKVSNSSDSVMQDHLADLK